MPNPKRRHSRARRDKRRAHDALAQPGTSVCPNCQERKLPTGCVRTAATTRAARSSNRRPRRGRAGYDRSPRDVSRPEAEASASDPAEESRWGLAARSSRERA